MDIVISHVPGNIISLIPEKLTWMKQNSYSSCFLLSVCCGWLIYLRSFTYVTAFNVHSHPVSILRKFPSAFTLHACLVPVLSQLLLCPVSIWGHFQDAETQAQGSHPVSSRKGIWTVFAQNLQRFPWHRIPYSTKASRDEGVEGKADTFWCLRNVDAPLKCT